MISVSSFPRPGFSRAALAAPAAALCALLAVGVAAPPKAALALEAQSVSATEIAWRHGDVADAFVEATEHGKPVLLYWGAVWCPPCNRLKAGLFRDPAFVARTRDFVAVYLDGDSPGAQAWGEQFAIRGYPTLIVLRPDRSEIARISGGGDPAQVASVLAAIHKDTANVKQLLERATTEPKSLSADDWTLLAGNGGWHDEAGTTDISALLTTLAGAAPTEALQRQFALQALAQRGGEAAAPSPAAQAEARKVLEAVLANPDEVKSNRATLTAGAPRIVQATTAAGPERQRLIARLVAVFDGFQADESLSIADRLSPLGAEIALARSEAGKDAKLSPALADKVRKRVAWADAAARNPAERQALISTAARYLVDAGDSQGAETLLKAELKTSQAPYYYMPALAGLAERRGDKAAAIDWLRQGYETSQGPASRVQWGVTYIEGLLRLAPGDRATIETATSQVIGELSGQSEGYRQRTRQRLEGLGKTLVRWSAAHDGTATLERLRTRTKDACTAHTDSKVLDACRNWLTAAAG